MATAVSLRVPSVRGLAQLQVMCVCLFVVCVCARVCVRVCVRVCAHTHVHVCVQACECASVRVCGCISICRKCFAIAFECIQSLQILIRHICIYVYVYTYIAVGSVNTTSISLN